MVYYRKYRSQTIDELDNASIRDTLSSILIKDPPHAFLFTGPKGLGKTSTARIVAKVVNCEKKNHESGITNHELGVYTEIEPCNRCGMCLSITNGTCMDVLEIDAASNRGIDEIRDLKEKIRLAPLSARKKVYIIDEVHMLTTEAFNALLKTLEEPPEHAMFILCTTEQQKVPATILSRCFHLAFSLATSQELIRSFKRIVDGEKIAIDDSALLLLAHLADGGFRDGAKILEEVVSLANGARITNELIEQKYKVSSITHKGNELIGFLVKRDMKAALEIITRLVSDGVEMRTFVLNLMHELHESLLMEVGIVEISNIKDPPAGRAGQRPKLGIGEIKKLFEVFSRAYVEMKGAVLPQLPLELAIVDVCLQEFRVQSSEFTVKGLEKENIEKKQIVEEDGVSVEGLRKQVGTINKLKALYGETVVPAPVKTVSVTLEQTINLMDVPADGMITKEWQDALWRAIIAEMKQYNHTIAGVLRSCMIREYNTKKVVIETAYKFHKEKLDEGKTRTALIKVCRILTGKDLEVEIELKQR